MSARTSAGVLCALAVLTALFAPAAAQEASSWSSETVKTPKDRAGEGSVVRGEAKRKPSKTGAGETAPPSTTKFAPPVAPSANTLPSMPKRPPASSGTVTIAKSAGEDAAYEAFDQGRYLTALELARKAADANDPQAHTLIGRLYQEGLGVGVDPLLAAQWYRRGAELGDVEAMFAFGIMLAVGEGIQKDRPGAARLFDEAAQRGHVLANYNLGLLFLRGDGKPENPRRAVEHIRFAAENGVAAAQYDLATLYATGTGVEANAGHAADWMQKAADAGHADAELEFGVWLFQGRGVPPSQTRGTLYFKSAADKGNVVAQNRLARCYAFGAGTDVDLIAAAMWHSIAKRGGAEDKKLDEIVNAMPRADRAKAQQMADAWLEAKAVR
jgi:hypothetical protein